MIHADDKLEDREIYKLLFEPGFSTRKRGWGLGLNLARRIIEEYHGGRLFVKTSKPGLGTVMRLELREVISDHN